MNEKKLSVKKVSLLMHKSEQFVRVGLQQQILPFGYAVKLNTRWSYYISPKLFYQYIGKEASTDEK